jgi:putative addiction module component (TIGR02574 family)
MIVNGGGAMTNKVEILLAEALKLTNDERRELTSRLWETVDLLHDVETDAAWSSEIKRRVDEIESGQADLITWEEFRRELMSELDGCDPRKAS